MLQISGHSDDLIELRGIVDDELNVYHPTRITVGDAVVVTVARGGTTQPRLNLGDEP